MGFQASSLLACSDILFGFRYGPYIYISPQIKPVEGQPEVPDCWKGIGIRIEDDVLVTEDGNDILTADVPKSVAELSW